MTFVQAYRELEVKFKAMVDKDKHSHGIDSVFLHNVYPTNRVDYVLVGMEPGLNGTDVDTAREKVAACEFENWGRYPQTSTLVFAVWKYLCDEDKTKYYFTDLAHGAMNTKLKDAKDGDRYERWFPLLEEELALVVHQFWIDGYRDFNLMRASAVVKRQSTFMVSWLRRSCHAFDSLRSAS